MLWYNKITMKVTTLKKKYKNKWVLARVLKEDKLNRVTDVEPIAASANQNDISKSIMKVKKGTHLAAIYTGKEFPAGKAVILYV